MSGLLLIVGTGGLAKEIGQLARQIDPERVMWPTIAYVAPSASERGRPLPFGRADFCDGDIAALDLPADVVLGVADPSIRPQLIAPYLASPKFSFPNLIHPSVHIDRQLVTLGKGNTIAISAIVTCDIRIGDFNLLNKGCMIGHDAVIGSYNTINPAASVSGRARIGDCCLIGVGARVLDKLSIADRTTVGAGSVVVSDIVEPGHSYFGIPARRLR